MEPDPRLLTMALLARIFARLAEREDVWGETLEGLMNKTVPFMEEARQEERIKVRRQVMLEVLEARFPGAVPTAVVQRINTETDLDKLIRWGKLAGTARTPEAFQAEMN